MFGKNKSRWFIGAGLALVLALGGGAGIAVATGAVADDDRPLSGETLRKASDAALLHTGGGTVVETEAGDDGAAYGVEVRLADGRRVELNLDADFNVIGDEPDDGGTNSGDSDDD